MFIHLISIHKFKTNATIQKVNTDLSVKHIFRGNSKHLCHIFSRYSMLYQDLHKTGHPLCWRLPSALPPVRGQKAVLRSHRADMAGMLSAVQLPSAMLYQHFSTYTPAWASSAWVSASMVVRSHSG